MGSLSGVKIKDTFGILLKMATSQLSATEEVVQDGAGNDSALKLSTDTVETTGSLKIGSADSSTTDNQALMLSAGGVVVQRNLSTNPIGTASITANSPIVATGSTVGLSDPSALTSLAATDVANNDQYLIWDESTSSYKAISMTDLATSVEGRIAGTMNVFTARLAEQNVASSGTELTFAATYGLDSGTSPATSSTAAGSATADVTLFDGTAIRTDIQFNTTSQYRIEIDLEVTTSGSDFVTVQLRSDSVNVLTYSQTLAAGTTTVSLSKTQYISAGGPNFQLKVTGSVATVKGNSTLRILREGPPNALFS
tara:strand:- start:2181 stop:3113 length:933 start_codon:yes stop_codon:yes gene_type:complete